MGNLDLYNRVRSVPEEAQKKITGGRLNGMTDINPMWRIKTLTDQFGPCGIGWRYTIDRQWVEDGANGEKCSFVNISLYVKSGEEWGAAIPGTGGSLFVATEKGALRTDDETFKKSLTDALGVACKALGIGADVYFEKDATKYQPREQTATKPQKEPQSGDPQFPSHKAQLANLIDHYGWTTARAGEIIKQVSAKESIPQKLVNDLSEVDFAKLLGGMADMGEDEMAANMTRDKAIANGSH